MQHKGNTYYQKNIGSVALFALAFLILVVSCPLKSIIVNNYVALTSIPSKSKLTNNNQHSRIMPGSYTTGCAVNNKTPDLQAYKNQHKNADAPVFNNNIFNHTGYYIHSFLDGIKAGSNLPPGYNFSALPLFLQHRSLLI